MVAIITAIARFFFTLKRKTFQPFPYFSSMAEQDSNSFSEVEKPAVTLSRLHLGFPLATRTFIVRRTVRFLYHVYVTLSKAVTACAVYNVGLDCIVSFSAPTRTAIYKPSGATGDLKLNNMLLFSSFPWCKYCRMSDNRFLKKKKKRFHRTPFIRIFC